MDSQDYLLRALLWRGFDDFISYGSQNFILLLFIIFDWSLHQRYQKLPVMPLDQIKFQLQLYTDNFSQYWLHKAGASLEHLQIKTNNLLKKV